MTCQICSSPLPPDRTAYCSEVCVESRQVLRRRARRRVLPRARSIAPKSLTARVLRDLARADGLTQDDLLEADAARPLDCPGREGSCPWAGCPHHLYLDVSAKTGSIRLNFPHLAGPLELARPCVLVIAREGPSTLEETGRHMNLTRERVRQIEIEALVKIRNRGAP